MDPKIKKIEMSAVAKSLEAERNFAVAELDAASLTSRVLTMQLNIFFSNLVLSMSDKNQKEPTTTLGRYREFYVTKFNAIRFIFEIFLSSIEFFSDKSLIYSLAVSEKINNHAVDLLILASKPMNGAFKDKIEKNKLTYSKFIKHFEKPSPLVPEDIDRFFSGDTVNPLRTRRKGEDTFESEFGFHYFKHAKLNYVNILEQNPILKSLLAKLQLKGIINRFTGDHFLKTMYAVLSSEIHPSFSAQESFEYFINKSEESQLTQINGRRESNDTFLKIIGILMDHLYKEQRGLDTAGLNYL